MIPASLPWLLALLLIALGACSDVKVDYSHSIMGSGTVMSDYKMSEVKNSEASGSLRGTGDVINKQAFSNNGSSLFTVEDNFLLAQKTGGDVKTGVNYPDWTESQPPFRLTGLKWAGKVEIKALPRPELPNPSEGPTDASSYASLAKTGEFETKGLAQVEAAPTNVTNTSAREGEGASRTGQASDHPPRWLNSNNVAPKNTAGSPRSSPFKEPN